MTRETIEIYSETKDRFNLLKNKFGYTKADSFLSEMLTFAEEHASYFEREFGSDVEGTDEREDA